ncbi:MAG: hypothetical protein V3U11_13265 [Planctomycetota bacterium]
MTWKERRKRLKVALSEIVCALWGCPRVVTYCWGYVNCARCKRQLADTLGGGTHHLQSFVIVGHGCSGCTEKWDQLRWLEKVLVPSKEHCLRDEKAEVLAKIRESSPTMAATLESLDAKE